MGKIRLILMNSGKTEYDFETEIETPKKEETITIRIDNKTFLYYDVKFIQYLFDFKKDFKYIMVTAIRN